MAKTRDGDICTDWLEGGARWRGEMMEIGTRGEIEWGVGQNWDDRR